MSARPRKRLQRTPRTMVRFHTDQVRRRTERCAARREVSPTAVVLVSVLANTMIGGETFSVTPSREYLAAQLGRTVRTISRLVAELDAAGLVDVDRAKNKWDRDRKRWRRPRCNRYRFILDQPRRRTRKARSHPGDIPVTGSKGGSTDSTPPMHVAPEGTRPFPREPIPEELRAVGLTAIRRLREERARYL